MMLPGPVQSVLTKSWISTHPRIVIGFVLVVCLGPFINKAIHTDDALFVWTAEWIQKHPADFFALRVNWWYSAVPMWVANYNPPLMSYFLAGVAALFGWSEMVLHLGGLTVACLAALGIYSLAQMWCQRPLLATLIALFTPAFLVSSTTLMCDVLMLTFWIWALVFWERALTSERSRWRFVGAGALAGLAVLTKYSAITLLPLLPILSLLRTRKLGWTLPGLAVPVFMLAGYEWMTARMYGSGLFFGAVHYAQTNHIGFPGGWKASGIIGLAFAGGSLLPVLFFAPFLWRPKTLWTGGIVISGTFLLTFRLCDNLGLMSAPPDLMKHWSFLIQAALLATAGLHLGLLVVVETWQRRDATTIILAFWTLSVIYFATVLNWTVNARSFLPMVPAMAILLVRRLEKPRETSATGDRLLWPLIPAAAITLSVVFADYQLANSVRTAAEQIAAKYKSAGQQLWFEGHGGCQYYMEKLGGLPIDVERSLLQPGDRVLVPELGASMTLPAGSVGWVERLEYAPFSWMNVMGGSASGMAGFHGANFGPVPFIFGRLPLQAYDLVEVFGRIQCNSQPNNPREVQAGDQPGYSSFSFFTFPMEKTNAFAAPPEVLEQVRLATQLDAAGKVNEAIPQYRKVLDLDANNTVALNNLALILATTDKPGLRNGEEAVQLAARAVRLTHATQPAIVGTLAAAYAQAGHFSQAYQTAQSARALAWLTGQREIAAYSTELLMLYSTGKTGDATPVP